MKSSAGIILFNTMLSIPEKTIKIIEERGITPRSRWYFLMKRGFIGALFGISILLGSFSVSTIIFIICDHDWDIFEYLDRSLLEDIIFSIPYLWVAILIFFAVVADYNFKHTNKGYRYETYKIILVSLISSFVIGTGLFFLGVDCEIHEYLVRQVPFYEGLVYNKKDIWVFPEKGLLSGEIIEVKGADIYILRDFSGKIWQIQDGKADWSDTARIQNGLKVRLIGFKVDDDIFRAKVIRLWERR